MTVPPSNVSAQTGTTSNHAGTADSLWFLDTLVSVHVSFHAGANRISLLEHQAPYADSPPLHIHVNEDEVFYILEGELRLQLGQDEHRLRAGQGVCA